MVEPIDESAALQSPPPVVSGEDKLTMTIRLTDDEHAAIERLMEEQELSRPQIFRCALRSYQADHERRKAGETVTWSGDAQRARDFAGPLATPPLVEEGRREAVANALHVEARRLARAVDGSDDCPDAYDQSALNWVRNRQYQLADAAILALTPVEGVEAALARIGRDIDAGETAGCKTRAVNGVEWLVIPWAQYEQDLSRRFERGKAANTRSAP